MVLIVIVYKIVTGVIVPHATHKKTFTGGWIQRNTFDIIKNDRV